MQMIKSEMVAINSDMSNFTKWVEAKYTQFPLAARGGASGPYSRSLHGKEFEPETLMQVEAQVAWLATQIRTTFGLDPRFDKDMIQKATSLMDQAADMLGAEGQLRHIKYEIPSKKE